MDISQLGSLGDLADQMQDAYKDGVGAMNQAGEEVAKDMKADHEIKVDVQVSAKVEGHLYKVDATIIFEIELDLVLGAAKMPTADLSSILDDLDVDLGDDKDAVMEQLGQPRAVGVVKEIDLKEIEVHSDSGKEDVQLNEEGTILVTVKDGKLLLNFESVLSYPKNPDVYVAIPSMEKMQEHIVVDANDLKSKVTFKWTEPDKDNLKVVGNVKIVKK